MFSGKAKQREATHFVYLFKNQMKK